MINKNQPKESKLNSSLKLLVKSSIIVFIGIFLSKILTYGYRIVIARYFGPEVYGLFSLAIIVLGFFVAFSSLGLTDGILRFIPFYRGKKEFHKIKYILKISSIILIFSSILLGILMFISAKFISIHFFHDESLIIYLKIFSFLVPISVFSNLYLSVLKTLEEIGWYSFIWNVLQNLIRLLAIIFFIFIGIKTNAVIFSCFLGFLLMLLVAYFVARYKLSKIFLISKSKRIEKRKIFNELFSYSWPIMFSGLIISLFYWIDSFFIGYFLGVVQVGLYNAALPLIGLLSVAPVLFSQLFFPLITKEFSRGRMKIINDISKQVGKWVFILNLPLFLFLVLFPGALINLFFGAEYLLAENALKILAFGGLASSIVFLLNDLMSMAGKSKIILINIIVTSILNIILNITLIPKFGMNGAAIATSISWLVLSLALLFESYAFLSIIPLKRKMIRVFFVSLIPLGILFYLKSIIPLNLLSLIMLGTFFFLSYLVLIFALGCLDKNDIFILKAIKNKVLNLSHIQKNIPQEI